MNNVFRTAKIFVLGLVALSVSVSAFADYERRIQYKELPQKSRQIVERHFKNGKVSSSRQEYDDGQTKYEVRMRSGHKIEFNSEGQWKEVKAPRGGRVPNEIVPQKIRAKVAKEYPNQRIVKIERKYYGGYEVDLANGLELIFDETYKLLRIDD